ncbi:sigma factor-like helix-turn-helix DNA-binding protein [Neobacillus vireti]|uniref:sigma factor-like helix-turn-helix DNA-binding protein n=1 Tax=Neobacillus vireti TaxID=220686 RepID=UPI0030007124
MEVTGNITKEDVTFFLDMIGSIKRPNYNIGDLKPYYKILDQRDSENFKRFIKIYIFSRDFLSDREKVILNEAYGVNEKRLTLKAIGEKLNIGPQRVSQIRAEAERKITLKLSKIMKHES